MYKNIYDLSNTTVLISIKMFKYKRGRRGEGEARRVEGSKRVFGNAARRADDEITTVG